MVLYLLWMRSQNERIFFAANNAIDGKNFDSIAAKQFKIGNNRLKLPINRGMKATNTHINAIETAINKTVKTAKIQRFMLIFNFSIALTAIEC